MSLDASVLEKNPYEGNAHYSQLESEVLWEYAKLAQHLKEVRVLDAMLTVSWLRRRVN